MVSNEPCFTVNVKLPSKSVIVPLAEAVDSMTEAPIIGNPSVLEVTFPFTIMFCPLRTDKNINRKQTLQRSFLFFIILSISLMILILKYEFSFIDGANFG